MIFLVFLWVGLELIISSNRGLELTDEGLYLLASREISAQAQWGFPAGWHTAPIFAIANSSVADFRTLGAVVLAVSGTFFGLTAFLGAYRPKSFMDVIQGKRLLLTGAIFSSVGLLSSLFYYSALLRAPSYNWVNLVGLLIAGSGFFLYLWAHTQEASKPIMGREIPGVFLISIGLIFSSVGKPSSPVLFMFVAMLIIVFLAGLAQALKMAAQTALFGGLTIVLLIIFGLWPANFLEIFVVAVQAPALVETQGIYGALRNLAFFPLNVLSGLTDYGVIVMSFLIGGFLAITLSNLFPKARNLLLFSGLCVAWFAALWIFGFSQWVFLDFSPQNRWVAPHLPLAVLILVAISLVVGFSYTKGVDLQPRLEYSPYKLAVASFSFWITLVFGFGSSHGVIRQSTLALIGFFIAIFSLLPPLQRKTGVIATWASMFTSLLLLLSLTLVDSHRNPYRLSAMSTQTVEITLRDKGESVLFVDGETAHTYNDLISLLDDAGFSRGDPVIGLVFRWNSTWPYAVGADVPSSLMPTLWGYDTSLEVLERNLNTRNRNGFDWENAWWFVSDPRLLTDEQNALLDESYAVVSRKTGRSFPDAYEWVGTAGEVDVYRPLAGH